MLINIRADGSIKASNDIDKVSGSADVLEKKAKVAVKAADDLAGRVERAGKEVYKTSSSFGL